MQISQLWQNRNKTRKSNLHYYFQLLKRNVTFDGRAVTRILDFVIACGNAQFARAALEAELKMPPDKLRQTVACGAGLS